MTPGGHLVGRVEELEAFDLLLSQLDFGESAMLELVGEPGIGKTRLLTELSTRADTRGYTVLSGCAAELEQDLPFWPFVDALDEYIRGIDPLQLGELGPDIRAELATVFPSMAALGDEERVGNQHERYRSHRAVRALLEVLAQRHPVVLVLDDLHWADPASVELLGALLNRPPAAPVLIAMAVRPHQMPDRLSTALERAHRRETLTRSEVHALTLEEARELLDGVAGEAAQSQLLYDESGGNPFYLQQLARSADGSGRLTLGGSEVSMGGARVPASVASALAEELNLLSDRERLVLQGAAVAGDPFEPELAAAAADVDEASAIEAVNELLRLDLVRATDVPRRFRFRHPLVRRTVYETAPGGWRITAHERAATALATAGALPMTLAHHVQTSARPGDRTAIALLREAGEMAARRAPATADRWLEAALRLLPEDAPVEERVELLLARSQLLAASGLFTESHTMLTEALAIVPADARSLRLQLIATCAVVENQSGRHQQAHSRLQTALNELADQEGPEAVSLMIALAVDGLFAAEYEAMEEWATKAVEASASLADRALQGAAFAVRAAGAALASRSSAQQHCDEAAELIDDLTDDVLGQRLDALAYLATGELYLDRIGQSARHAERALAIGRATGQGELFPLIVVALGSCLWLRGQMTESSDVFDGAIEAARLQNNRQSTSLFLYNRSFAALAAGDTELALSTGEESMELANGLDRSILTTHSALALAGALAEAGEPERAASLLVSSAGGDELRSIGGGRRARYLGLLTRCFLASGRRAEAERAAAAAQACAEEVGLPMAAAMASCAAAALHFDAGDFAAAAARALDAAAGLEEFDDVYDAAVARRLAARSLAAAGDNEKAADEFERVAQAFDSFGSIRYRDEAEQELRRLGRTTYRRSTPGKLDETGLAALSGRELQIARLVADRKTNLEIAAELFLSPKTVEAHLRTAFRKVNVTSRVELARAVERADRVSGASR